MKAPITPTQAWAVIAESAGWNTRELPVLPDMTLMWAEINAWHESKNPYPKNVAAVNETVIAVLQAYGQQCAAHARKLALDEAMQACERLEIAIDGGGNTYYRPADARQCVSAIEALKGK